MHKEHLHLFDPNGSASSPQHSPWDRFIGQTDTKEELRRSIANARHSSHPFDSVLLISDRAGMGRSALGNLLAHEQGGTCVVLESRDDAELHSHFMSLGPSDVVLIRDIDDKPELWGKLTAILLRNGFSGSIRGHATGVTVAATTTAPEALPQLLANRLVQYRLRQYTYSECLRYLALMTSHLGSNFGLSLTVDAMSLVARATDGNPGWMREILEVAFLKQFGSVAKSLYRGELNERSITDAEIANILTLAGTDLDALPSTFGELPHQRNIGIDGAGTSTPRVSSVRDAYRVVLAFEIDAESPAQAVAEAVTQLTRRGLSSWVYRVVNDETGDSTFLNGEGEPVDMSKYQV